MTEDYLAQGIAAIKAGNKEEAHRLIDLAIHSAPDDERPWLWLSQISADDEERFHCIKEILRINPNNEKAKQKYDELIGLNYISPPPIPQMAVKAKNNNTIIGQGIKNKERGLSTIEWIVVGIIFGIAALVIVGMFLFKKINITKTSILNAPSISCQSVAMKYQSQILPLILKFGNETLLGQSTPHTSLTPIINTLIPLMEDAGAIIVPDCVQQSSQLILRGMDDIIDGFIYLFAEMNDHGNIAISQGMLNIMNGGDQLKALASGQLIPTPMSLP